jgi:hypothetical protein
MAGCVQVRLGHLAAEYQPLMCGRCSSTASGVVGLSAADTLSGPRAAHFSSPRQIGCASKVPCAAVWTQGDGGVVIGPFEDVPDVSTTSLNFS